MKSLRPYIRNAELPAFFAVVSVAGFLMRWLSFGFESMDYTYFLSRWYEEVEALGGFPAVGTVVGNYTPAYMLLMAAMTYLPLPPLYAIKLVSVAADYLLAVYVGLLVRRLSGSDVTGLTTYTAALFLPAVFLNSAVWGQCDSIYVAFLVMCLYYLMQERSVASMVCFGAAFAFKLQSVFFLPVVILAALKGKIRWWSPAAAVLVFFASGLPAILAGMSFADAYGVYIQQAGQYSELSLNAPNFYIVLDRMVSAAACDAGFAASLVCFAFGAVGCTMLPLYRKRYDTGDDRLWLTMAAFFAAFMPYVLPHMHERYWYLSDILALVLLFVFPKRWYMSLAVMLPSLYAVCCYLFGSDRGKLPLMALLMLAGICLLGLQLLRLVRAAKPLPDPPIPDTEARNTENPNTGEPI